MHKTDISVCPTYKTELNDLKKTIYLRKPEGSVERISVCNAIKNLAEHGIHCLQCFYTNDLITMLS